MEKAARPGWPFLFHIPPALHCGDNTNMMNIPFTLTSNGNLFVISGPSGVGKDAVITELLDHDNHLPNIVRCVTATTRMPRPGEIDGLDYHFMPRELFRLRIDQSYFLEYALYNDEYYGTPSDFVKQQRAVGNDVILKIEVKGALQAKQAMPDAVLIFILPPSMDALESRLKNRATDDASAQANRLRIAREEMQMVSNYDYAVVNDQVSNAVSIINSIIVAERHRIMEIR